MKVDRDLRRIVIAIVGGLAAFCVVATIIYYKMADVAVNGFVHGGPATLAGSRRWGSIRSPRSSAFSRSSSQG